MTFDIDKLSKYDTKNAKAGDKVILARSANYSGHWTSFSTCTVKSVSAKRGDITFYECNTRLDKYGRVIGRARYDTSRTVLLELTDGNRQELTKYWTFTNCVHEVSVMLKKLTYERLCRIPDEKLEKLYDILQEITKEK